MTKYLKWLPLALFTLCWRAYGDAVVNTPDETALRTAITTGGRVTFNCEGRIVLASPIEISAPLILDATGHNITLSGDGKTQLFIISATEVEFRSLIIADGFILGVFPTTGQDPAPHARGGAILAENSEVTFTSCALSNNVALGGSSQWFDLDPVSGYGFGGAIHIKGGHLRATDSTFVVNRAKGGDIPLGNTASLGGAEGGGVWASNTQVAMTNCVFWKNDALGGSSGPQNPRPGSVKAGGLYLGNSPGSFMKVAWETNSCLPGASTYAYGTGPAGQGGAVFSDGAATFTDCRVNWNSVKGAGMFEGGPGMGGGICALGAIKVSNTTFSHNTARGGNGSQRQGFQKGPGGGAYGGGLASFGPLSITNSTFAFNSATGGNGGFSSGTVAPGGGAEGAGLYLSSTGSIAYATIAGNTATGGRESQGMGPETTPGAGGIAVASGGEASLFAVILFNGTNLEVTGNVEDLGYNIHAGTDPLLSEFGPHGGFGDTFLLQPGSPALDAASPTDFPATDQRGVTRSQGSSADIGAVEMASLVPPGPKLKITVISGAGQGVSIHVANDGLRSVQVQRSFDLKAWESIGNASVQPSFDVVDSSPAAAAFYKAVAQ